MFFTTYIINTHTHTYIYIYMPMCSLLKCQEVPASKVAKTWDHVFVSVLRTGMGPRITTEIVAASDFEQPFYYAEDYHQQYLAKPGARHASMRGLGDVGVF